MIETGKRPRNRLPSEPDLHFACFRAGCRCEEPNIVMRQNGGLYCTQCKRFLMFRPMGDRFVVFENVIEMIGYLERFRATVTVVPDAVPGHAGTGSMQEVPSETGSDAAPTSLREVEGPGDATPSEAVDELREEVRRLTEERDTAIADRDREVGRLVSENKGYRERMEELEGRCSSLERERNDLDATLGNVRREIERLGRVKMDGIAAAILEFATAMENLVAENDDAEGIRTNAEARLEQLDLQLRNSGMALVRHRRGDDLGNGLEHVEIRERPTDDPALDGKVARVDRYGCHFVNGVCQDRPESLTVYRLAGRPADAGGTTANEEGRAWIRRLMGR